MSDATTDQAAQGGTGDASETQSPSMAISAAAEAAVAAAVAVDAAPVDHEDVDVPMPLTRNKSFYHPISEVDPAEVAMRISMPRSISFDLTRSRSSVDLNSKDVAFQLAIAAGALHINREPDPSEQAQGDAAVAGAAGSRILSSRLTPMRPFPAITRAASSLRMSHADLPGLLQRTGSSLGEVDALSADRTTIVELPEGTDIRQLRAMWHTLGVAAVTKRLETDAVKGLSQEEVATRLSQFGANELSGKGGFNPVVLFLKNLFNFLLILLMVAMVFSFATHEWVEGGVLLFVVLFNALLGFFQEYKSEKTLEALQKLGTATVKVMRAGKLIELPSTQLVPGDIVYLEVGNSVPADMRLFETEHLDVDEATLTGESVPVRKGTAALAGTATGLGDRINMAYSGCLVARGKGKGIVVATGMGTELGHVAKSVANNGKSTTPLQREIRRLSIILFAIGLLFGFVVFASNSFDFSNETIIYAIAVVVAIIPESLALMMTLTLSMAVKRMATQNVIVRKVGVLETLGRVTDICSDKTGTLTQAKMVAVNFWLPHRSYHVTGVGVQPVGQLMIDNKPTEPDVATLKALRICALCNEGQLRLDDESKEWIGLGTPTEIALLVLARKCNVSKQAILDSKEYKFTAEMPFDSSVKSMTAVYKNLKENKHHVFMKGAPENVLRACTRMLIEDEVVPLQDGFNDIMYHVMSEMTGNGQRVVALCYREDLSYHVDMTRDDINQDMVFAGLVGIYDPPRAESGPSVMCARQAGITVHMLTGDHISTATAIALDINIIDKDEEHPEALAMVAAEFDNLKNEQADELLELPHVVARCSPDTKVKMIKALHRRNRITVMTGDGVNDAPALKASDVGVAMGKTGSEVTKQAADIVLTTDNFASIVVAIEEGRRIFANIQKFVVHLLTSNIASLIVLVVGLSIRDASNHAVFPMSALEILLVNTLGIAVPALGLASEAVDTDAMKKPPTSGDGLFSKEVIMDTIVYGILTGALSLCSFVVVLYGFYNGLIGSGCNGLDSDACSFVFYARATCFTVLSCLLLVNSFHCRHSRRYLWQMNMLENVQLLITNAIVIGVLVIVLYVPVLNTSVFKHRMLSWEWIVVAVATVIYVALVQIYKMLKNRFMPEPTVSSFRLRSLVTRQ